MIMLLYQVMSERKIVLQTGTSALYVRMQKRTGVMGSEGTTPFGAELSLPVTGSAYSIYQIVSNVNTADAEFLKYIPDEFWSEEQNALNAAGNKRIELP